MPETNPFSHLDTHQRPRMVDVTEKVRSHRVAIAQGTIQLQTSTLDLIRDNRIRKGNVLITAELAGVQAAKQTPTLIPLCHPLLLSKISVTATLIPSGVKVTAEVKCTGRTGVEMEALTAVSVALLTIYDMCKALDKKMVIKEITLLQKNKETV